MLEAGVFSAQKQQKKMDQNFEIGLDLDDSKQRNTVIW